MKNIKFVKAWVAAIIGTIVFVDEKDNYYILELSNENPDIPQGVVRPLRKNDFIEIVNDSIKGLSTTYPTIVETGTSNNPIAVEKIAAFLKTEHLNYCALSSFEQGCAKTVLENYNKVCITSAERYFTHYPEAVYFVKNYFLELKGKLTSDSIAEAIKIAGQNNCEKTKQLYQNLFQLMAA